MPKHESTKNEKGSSDNESQKENHVSSLCQVEFFCCGSNAIFDFIIKDFKAKHHDKQTTYDHVEHVKEEISMIEMSNATIDPGTMVVHFQNTGITN